MRATVREALEQIHGITAIELLATGGPQQQTGKSPMRVRRYGLGGDDATESTGGTSIHRDDTAKAKADAPHLTGDPEWDALEMAETDPGKEPLVIQY